MALFDIDALRNAWSGAEPSGGDQGGNLPAFIVEELSGAQRRLTFTGHSLPLAEGARWETKQRRKKQWYPGNPEATVQVLGPEEGPSTFTLMLDYRWLGGGSQEVYLEYGSATIAWTGFGAQNDPLALGNLLADIARGGQELKVTWGPMVRRGMLDVTVEPRNELVVQVVLSFDWHAKDDPIAFLASPPFDFHGPEQSLLGLIKGFADLLAAPGRVAAEFLDQVNGALGQVESAVQAYSKMLDTYENLATAGRDAIQNCLGIVGTMLEGITNLISFLDVDASAITGSDDQAQVWLGAGITGTGQDQALQMAAQAKLARKELLNLFGGEDVVGVEVAYAGATLQKYAATYYHDPSLWIALGKYNLISSPTLEAGIIVVVPKLDMLAAFR